MRVTPDTARGCFRPLIGKRPWRVALGWGSFLTFEFGARVKVGGFQHGAWHLWVYMCSWRLDGDRGFSLSSESPRERIRGIVSRLAAFPLSDVKMGDRARSTRFDFGNRFSLTCTRFDPHEESNRIDPSAYWMLFMPRRRVLTVQPGSRISIQRADRTPYRE